MDSEAYGFTVDCCGIKWTSQRHPFSCPEYHISILLNFNAKEVA